MQKVISEIRLSVEEYAELRGCSVQYVRKLCADGKLEYELEKQRGGRSGVVYRIPLASLPKKEIQRYIRRKEKGERLQNPEPEEPIIRLEYERLSQEERAELNLKNKILDNWITYRLEQKKKGISLADADANYVRIIQLQYTELDMSERTIRRWDKIRRTKGEAALVDRRGKHESHQTKYNEEVFAIFSGFYLNESKPSVTSCIMYTELSLKKDKRTELLPLPSERSFLRWIEQKIPPYVIEYEREGEKSAVDKYGDYIPRQYENLNSNDLWVCDNHTIDVMVNKDGKVLRVYLTAFMDIRSRKLVGYYVTLSPSSDATLYALRKGIERNGIPKALLADNGREFLTHDIGGMGHRKSAHENEYAATILDRLGIQFSTALPRNARAKIIERMFLTLKNEFSKLFSSYTGGTILERPASLKELVKNPDDVVELDSLNQFISAWIDGIYNNRKHTGKGMRNRTPNEVFSRYLLEKTVASEEVLNLMMLRNERLQKVRKDGVYITLYGQKIHFCSHELKEKYIEDKVFVRFDPGVLKSVRVYDESDRFLMTVPQMESLGYFDNKDAVGKYIKEQRQFVKVMSTWGKQHAITEHKAIELVMEQAKENMELGLDAVDPKIIRILQNPDIDLEEKIEEVRVVGGEPLDLAAANRYIRNWMDQDE